MCVAGFYRLEYKLSYSINSQRIPGIRSSIQQETAEAWKYQRCPASHSQKMSRLFSGTCEILQEIDVLHW